MYFLYWFNKIPLSFAIYYSNLKVAFNLALLTKSNGIALESLELYIRYLATKRI